MLLPGPPTTGAVHGVLAPGDTQTLHSVMRYSPDEGLRRAAYMHAHAEPAVNLRLLDELVAARCDLESQSGRLACLLNCVCLLACGGEGRRARTGPPHYHPSTPPLRALHAGTRSRG